MSGLVDKAGNLLNRVLGVGNQPEAAPAPESRPAYIPKGGEGMASNRKRRIVAMVKLPQYRDPKTGDPLPLSIRYQYLDRDMRDAMAKAARRVLERAARYNKHGFAWNADDIEYAVSNVSADAVSGGPMSPKLRRESSPTLIATLLIERDA